MSARRQGENCYFGASVAGPAHRARSEPNEDRWLGARGRFGALIVVSDGLGSRVEARKGSTMACRAVLETVRTIADGDSTDLPGLLPQIEAAWLTAIAPSLADDCAATCLFALASPRGGMYIAGVGDGMAVLRSRDGSVDWVVGPQRGGFATETNALGTDAVWQSRSTRWRDGDVVVLATDGVSDDIVSDRIDGFTDWLMTEIAPLPPSRRWRTLAREFADWPTPHHLDDKTLAVLAPTAGAFA